MSKTWCSCLPPWRTWDVPMTDYVMASHKPNIYCCYNHSQCKSFKRSRPLLVLRANSSPDQSQILLQVVIQYVVVEGLRQVAVFLALSSLSPGVSRSSSPQYPGLVLVKGALCWSVAWTTSSWGSSSAFSHLFSFKWWYSSSTRGRGGHAFLFAPVRG